MENKYLSDNKLELQKDLQLDTRLTDTTKPNHINYHLKGQTFDTKDPITTTLQDVPFVILIS